MPDIDDFLSSELDEERGNSGCWRCDGGGWIITCIDDICRGAGECMHGDGEEPCPVCNKDLSKDRW